MKTKEELNALKEEVESLNKKLAELSEEELEQVTGGVGNYGKEQNPAEFEHYDDGNYYYGDENAGKN